jgi:hypothetical protein
VRYYTIQLLTALLTNSLKRCPVSPFLLRCIHCILNLFNSPFYCFRRFRLQEAILLIPRGITVLMDMLMDREVLILPSVLHFLQRSMHAILDISVVLKLICVIYLMWVSPIYVQGHKE